MRIVRSKPTPVKSPGALPQRDGMPWCDEHEEFYEHCICPKPFSSIDTDGWHVEVDDKGKGTAYPSEQLYNDLALWVDRRGNKLVCTRCGKSMEIAANYTETEISDLVESFFEIHYECLPEGGEHGS